MARHSSHREDLIQDATAMVDRAEFVSNDARVVVAGFRPEGACSFYFGEQPVYQFTAEPKLRRVFLDGILKAESGRLVRWEKSSRGGQVQMIARPVGTAEQSTLLSDMHRHLIELREGMLAGTWRLSKEVSQPGSHAAQRVQLWLANMPSCFEIAESPHVSAK